MNLKSSPPRAAGPPPPRSDPAGLIAIGELARRSGVAASALRFYEEQGLIAGTRSAGGRRLYPRHVLRRVAFIRAAQTVGLPLEQVRASLATLPDGRTPTKADWQRLAGGWQPLIDARIEALQVLRQRLAQCVGCGCLSLTDCALYNPQDLAATAGDGARYLLGDTPDSVAARARAAAPPKPRRRG